MSKPFKVERLTKIHEHWDSDDPTKFLVQAHAEITCAGEAGGEAVTVTVMSPAQLAADLDAGAVELGRGLVFMHDYDEASIIRTLQRIIDGAKATDWDALQDVLGQYFEWLE
ncbi:MAG: immunity 8 family protein [Proteobacteria bacterium]|nr:immunity 8 family protein [Pseudomonadota bacterium]